MTLDKTQQNALTQKILEALTPAQREDLLPRQTQLIEDGISDLLKNHSVDEVTVEMIQGQYELVTEIVAPAERILMSEKPPAYADKD
jgi:Holliday junction resolvasome RuvABC endonuclease subunit